MPSLLAWVRYLMVLPAVVVLTLPRAAGAVLPPPTVLRVAPPSGAVAFGQAVAGLADVNGDGTSDFLIGASGSGRVHLVSGSSRTILADIADPAGSGFDFGFAVAAVGDVNGDRVADFAVGAPSGPDPARGRAFVFSGATGALIRQLVPATADYLAFGRSVAGGGDLSGDGVPDVLVGAPGLKPGRGTVFAFSGSDGTQLWSTPEPSPQPEPSASFGDGIAFISDLSGDGVVDLLVSSPLASYSSEPIAPGGDLIGDVLSGVLGLVLSSSSPGRVHVLSGVNGQVVRTTSDPAPHDKDAFGGTLTAIGDQDGDGVVDHLIGERGANQVHLYSGKDGRLIRSMATPADARGTGSLALARVDDKDGDGRDDFWVGIQSARTAYLMNGMGSVLASVVGPSRQGAFGAAVGTVGSIGDDRGADLVVGDPAEPGGGAAYLFQAGPISPMAASAQMEQPTECSGLTCANVLRLTAQAPASTTTVPTTTVPTTTVPTTTTTVAPPTATLPKPATAGATETSLPGTGGIDRSKAGLIALGLGVIGLSVVRRACDPRLGREPPSTG